MRTYFALALLVMISGLVGYRSAIGDSPFSGHQRGSSDEPHYINPVIQQYGKVVKLPDSVHQPRNGSKIVVDVTQGGDPDKLNSALEKVCRYVNIYTGAGQTPAIVEIAVVLHGDATLTILRNDIYAARFNTKDNPNLSCLHELNQAGVKVSVCGQSLIGKGAKPTEVSEHAQVAVSALTSLVNLQAEGYSYIPLLK